MLSKDFEENIKFLHDKIQRRNELLKELEICELHIKIFTREIYEELDKKEKDSLQALEDLLG